MPEQESQIEKLTAQNVSLQEQVAELQKELSERECRHELKERTFWIAMPTVWFSVAEAEFKVAGIVDDTAKYNYVLSQLDKEESNIVEDIINNPPISGKYEKIKEALINRLSEPEQERIRRLFDEKLEDKTPSQFYRHLQCLAGAGITVDKIILHLWMRQLPRYCQQILASRPEESNYKLAELADSIMEATKISDSSKAVSVVHNIQQSVDELGKQVVALETTIKQQNRSRCPTEERSPCQTPIKICWYHKQWGVGAFRCISPCNWQKSEKKEE